MSEMSNREVDWGPAIGVHVGQTIDQMPAVLLLGIVKEVFDQVLFNDFTLVHHAYAVSGVFDHPISWVIRRTANERSWASLITNSRICF